MTEWLTDAIRYVEQWLEHQVRVSDLPGCTVAFAKSGTLVSEKGFGVADLATGEALTPHHRFRVASHSKTFCSAALFKLHEQGRLHLDDPIGRHVPGLEPATSATTIAQLLSHTSGLMRDGTVAPHWLIQAPFFDESELRGELGKPPVLDANQRFKYSNLGFGLLGLAIESITGEPFASWIAREIVTPAGLAFTAPDMPVDAAAEMARGHGTRWPSGHRTAVDGHGATRAMAAATGFVSTAGDLARFFGSLDPAVPSSVLSPASRREMTRPQWRVPHADGDRSYGLGTMSGTIEGHAWFGHGGAFPGFISRTMALPDWGISASVVTNAIDGLANPWAEGIVGIMHRFAKEGPAALETAAWVGRWWTIWGPLDLVPMGRKVLVANPSSLTPFAEAAEMEVTGPGDGRIMLANGFGAHGEPTRLVPGADGAPTRLHLGPTVLVREAALVSGAH